MWARSALLFFELIRAPIARQIADITIGSDDLYRLVMLKDLSDRLMKRIRLNYRVIVGFNSGLIILGLAGILSPGTSALLHNMSTVMLGLGSTTKLLQESQDKAHRICYHKDE